MPERANQPVFIYTTFGAREDAERVGAALVAERLIACANIFPGMVSVYEWQGAIRHDSEVAAILKTRKGRLDEAMAELKRLHSYETPAIIVLPVDGGSAEYCAWIADMTRTMEG